MTTLDTTGAVATPPATSPSHRGALTLDNVSVAFSSGVPGINRTTVRAVQEVDLHVTPGEIVALVGESGCGKSTLGRVALGLQRPTSGVVVRDGRAPQRRAGTARDVQVVFQDPAGSLNPRQRIGTILARALRIAGLESSGSVEDRVAALLEEVGLAPAERYTPRFPHELSGGQQQRVAIARAIGMQPRIIVADEPASALDVSVRAQIMALFRRLRDDHNTGVLLISHDLATVRSVADRIAVMYLGRIVEHGTPTEVFTHPCHPYTAALIEAVPSMHSPRRRRPPVLGEPPSASHIPPGCAFSPRCPSAADRCTTTPPELTERGRHPVACHHPLPAADERPDHEGQPA